MDAAEHLARLREEGELFAEAATAAGLDAAVPTCPGWQVRDLVQHLGGVHRWATSYVVTGNPKPSSEKEDARYFAAIGDGELLPAYRSAHAALVGALAGAPSDRVDAEMASGRACACEAGFGADGIDELLYGFFSRARGRLVADPPVALGIRATDTGDTWTIRIEPDRRAVTGGVGEADCVVSGPAADLYLLLWNRRTPDERFSIEGNRHLLELWRTKAVIT